MLLIRPHFLKFESTVRKFLFSVFQSLHFWLSVVLLLFKTHFHKTCSLFGFRNLLPLLSFIIFDHTLLSCVWFNFHTCRIEKLRFLLSSTLELRFRSELICYIMLLFVVKSFLIFTATDWEELFYFQFKRA